MEYRGGCGNLEKVEVVEEVRDRVVELGVVLRAPVQHVLL
jgi:hypothetical protein